MRRIMFVLLLIIAVAMIIFGLFGNGKQITTPTPTPTPTSTPTPKYKIALLSDAETDLGMVGWWSGKIHLMLNNVGGGTVKVTDISFQVSSTPEHYSDAVQNCDYYGDCRGRAGADGYPEYVNGDGAVLFSGTEKVLPVKATTAIRDPKDNLRPDWPTVFPGKGQQTDFDVAVVSQVAVTLHLIAEVKVLYGDGHTATVTGKPITMVFLPRNYPVSNG